MCNLTLHFHVGDPLAESPHARLLPRPQLLPFPAGGHAGRWYQLSRLHLGKLTLTLVYSKNNSKYIPTLFLNLSLPGDMCSMLA